MPPAKGYEFNSEQNVIFKGLANSMGWIGCLFSLIGLINLLLVGLMFMVIYQAQIPEQVLSKIPQEAIEQVKEGVNKTIPSGQMQMYALTGLLNGVIITMMGFWTWVASGSFQRIAETENKDIDHLMSAMVSMRSMYRLIMNMLFLGFTLIVLMSSFLAYMHFMT